jgi:hypothetical protein
MNAFIRLTTEPSKDKQYVFCNVVLHVADHIIGDVDAWSVGGLFHFEVTELIARLKNPSDAVNVHRISEPNQNFDVFCRSCSEAVRSLHKALPENVENFDGERAFFSRLDDATVLVVWRNNSTAQAGQMVFARARLLQAWIEVKERIFLELSKPTGLVVSNHSLM